jgi:DNA-binding response OmpR family regulator
MADAGFSVTPFETGERAVEFASDASFDVVVADVNLPGMDGIESVTSIRRSKYTPVVFISADPADRSRVARVGDGAFLEKPFSPFDLITAIKSVLGFLPSAEFG